MAAVPPNSLYDPRNPLGLPTPQTGWRGLPASPSSLDGNCGPGYQQRPAWQTLNLTPLPRTSPSGAHLAATSQSHTERSLLQRLLSAESWNQIRHYAEILLGPQCFELGVCYGIAKNLAKALWGLVDLLKTLALAGLYARATHRPVGWSVLEWGDYWEARGAQYLIGQQMKEAYERVVKLKAQLAQIMHDPIGFFKQIGTQLKQEYVAKWNRFQQLEQDSSLSHQFEAGEIFGEVLAEVVLTILAVIDGAGVLAKIASKAPELLRIVETVRTVEAANKAEGVAEAARVAKELEEAKSVRPSSGPGSAAHKAQRWNEYQERGGSWDYDRWSKTYDNNMQRAAGAHSVADAYRDELGWGEREVTVDVEGVPRRLDIADVASQRGVEVKSGYQTLNQSNQWELLRDQTLVEQGWDMEWHFNDSASGPLLDGLRNAGIRTTGPGVSP